MFSEYQELTEKGKKKVDCWSDKNALKPDEVRKFCNKKFWFDCDNCPHDFEKSLNMVSKGIWCPYCCKPTQKYCIKDCDYCFNKTFASYSGLTPNNKKKVDCWSDKNALKPNAVSICNGKNFN